MPIAAEMARKTTGCQFSFFLAKNRATASKMAGRRKAERVIPSCAKASKSNSAILTTFKPAAVIMAIVMVVLIALLFKIEDWFGKDVEG